MANISVFVGSSSEGLDFARAVRRALEEDPGAPGDPRIEVTLWKDDFFAPTSTFVEELVNALPRFDFAVLVLTPDDLIQKREISSFGPRDNVVFELGLFMGHLGRPRTFLLVQEGAATLPSDLSGVVTARFRSREDGNHRAAVGAACDRILKLMRELGVSDRKAGRHIADISHRQDAIESQMRILGVLARGLITSPEKDHMRGLAGDGPFTVWFHNDMMRELQHLDALRYVLPNAGFGLNDIRREDGKPEQFDLKRYVHITEAGRDYLNMLEELSPRA